MLLATSHGIHGSVLANLVETLAGFAESRKQRLFFDLNTPSLHSVKAPEMMDTSQGIGGISDILIPRTEKTEPYFPDGERDMSLRKRSAISPAPAPATRRPRPLSSIGRRHSFLDHLR